VITVEGRFLFGDCDDLAFFAMAFNARPAEAGEEKKSPVNRSSGRGLPPAHAVHPQR
jgi:hypothetical protein